MTSYGDLPQFDDQGNNLVDPADRRGRKTAYITRVHCKALERYVGRGPGLALDLGCGYGRMAGALRGLGWDVIGLDPSARILSFAADAAPGNLWCVGQLPELPFVLGCFDLVLTQNLLRVLHLNKCLQVAESCSIPDVLRPGGQLVIVDNIWRGNPDFVRDEWIVSTFTGLGLRLVKRAAIRSARWWGIYAVRYGLIPESWHEWLADFELRTLEKRTKSPRLRYYNVLYVFEKPV